MKMSDIALIVLIIMLLCYLIFGCGCAITGTTYDLDGIPTGKFDGQAISDVEAIAISANTFLGMDGTDWLELGLAAAGVGGLGIGGKKVHKHFKKKKEKKVA